ncbi:YSC84-related protein [Propionivibrio sp.]|uniref:lipid-binding SYLF domain-containing protein n=1 Tax=Propionivibrio sp. TaxID=2212460 RepID=UPI003BF3663A
MLGRFLVSIAFALSLTLLGSSPTFAKDSKEAQRAEVRKTSQKILNQLYRVSPSAKGAVASTAGYAVFSNFGMKLFLAGGGGGSGMAVNNATKKEVFMKMVEVQAGLGFGVKKFSVVFIFETEKALNEFVNSGWEFGGQATAAATDGGRGGAYQGAVSVMPGVWMYQMTDKGLALELTGKGTKYYKNDDLN